MLPTGKFLTYWEMCAEEGFGLQRGMYYRPRGRTSVLLMSVRPGAPYADRVEEDGRVLIYEGHDMPRKGGTVDPKTLDQPNEVDGKPTQNALFFKAAKRHSEDGASPEFVKVYEKLRQKIWVYDGVFQLVDAWIESSGSRRVFKFRLIVAEGHDLEPGSIESHQEASRVIPSSVMVEVWKRDKGKCAKCGSDRNLQFDHIIPFSKGGSSMDTNNIRILCSKCNLAKRDKID